MPAFNLNLFSMYAKIYVRKRHNTTIFRGVKTEMDVKISDIKVKTQIYSKNDMTYWQALDKKVAEYAANNGFMYVIDEEPFLRNPTGKPIIINYFYHSQIKQSAKQKKQRI